MSQRVQPKDKEQIPEESSSVEIGVIAEYLHFGYEVYTTFLIQFLARFFNPL